MPAVCAEYEVHQPKLTACTRRTSSPDLYQSSASQSSYSVVRQAGDSSQGGLGRYCMEREERPRWTEYSVSGGLMEPRAGHCRSFLMQSPSLLSSSSLYQQSCNDCTTFVFLNIRHKEQEEVIRRIGWKIFKNRRTEDHSIYI